ncbi:probable LRR receptor-like serine/threonine-protein kinase At1g06840 isoform X2 [Corylus avellana]|uniref:probable LRR receptor-like serine/threonine-protein kinase At1g06840 isoform X2 n=1 Tax=Corylus avellana TaxID=13451 RepID=UPI002869F7F9|nr:probable LRR receptor-like serine/threonine-protein kinase At1g06840 isoform X2 [Corylus avellana]
MYQSRAWMYGVFIVSWLCWWSSLPILAQPSITHPREVTALQAIQRSLIDPNKNLTNWNQGDPCTSNWTGVVCFNTPSDDGHLHVERLDFMWNNISGSIPKEIGNISSLKLLLLNGNQLTGPLPKELGSLSNLDRIQIDENRISGSIPISFSNLNKAKHFHMNNNSISGQIPPELSKLPILVHLLVDNNNLSGHLPSEFSKMPNLRILQLDNNHFDGTTIPSSYSNMSKLLKLSLRNCNLHGPIPDLSQIPSLLYLDLSSNRLNGSIPPNWPFKNITTIDLSNNNLTGTVPPNFSGLPHLQKLSIANNALSGSVPSTIWLSRTLNEMESLKVELQNNKLSDITGSTIVPPNVTVWLQGNPLCSTTNLVQLCRSESEDENNSQSSTNTTSNCPYQGWPPPCEYIPTAPVPCICAVPLLVGYRLKSPGFIDFPPYRYAFEDFLTSALMLFPYQLYIYSFAWEGPRLRMYLKIFPVYDVNKNSHIFNGSEVRRIMSMFISWNISDPDVIGPYEVLSFTDVYNDVVAKSPGSTLSKGALAGIILGTIAGAVTLSAIVSLLILRKHTRKHHAISKRRRLSRASMKIDGVKDFTYGEMALATNNFNISTQVGQGGYGKVYKGILADGTVVAIKRAQEGSLQGEKEFLTEIELLSRLHHRNLVSLIGYCDEEGEQMLVYEFMPNGTLRDQLSAKSKEPMSFDMRLGISLGSAKGILYLHTEANPPIFHRDIKASNILLDSNYTAKVADFGLSRLAPVPIEGVVPAHVSTVVKGTPGYLDPEYFLTHQLTDKSDVYSLGVVFLELLTGMQPISHGKNIVREVNVAHQSGMIFGIIDGRMGSYPSDCVVKFLSLALKCCQDKTDARPSMAEVVRELENIWVMMPDSDIRKADPMVADVVKDMTPPSSSSNVKHPYVSMDLLGSNLDSGVVPTITPR